MRNEHWLPRGALVGLLIGAAVSAYWLGPHRPARLDEPTGAEFIVSSADDSGPGTLREALFGAARSTKQPLIRLRIPRVVLSSPLPPAVHPVGLVIESSTRTVVDAKLVAGPAIEVHAPHVVLRNLTIEHAAGTALLVHTSDVVLRGIHVGDSDIAIAIVGDAPHLEIHQCELVKNRVGLQIAAPATGVVEGCRFEQHGESAVWAVRAAGGSWTAPLQFIRNSFIADHDAMVFANLSLTVEHNEFVGSSHNAVTVLGGQLTFRANKVRGARGAAVFLDNAEHVVIADNEIGDNPGTGIFVRAAAGVVVEHNRIYRNNYGIVAVYGKQGAPLTLEHNLIFSQHLDGVLVIGASPVIRANRTVNNSGAGIKLLDAVPHTGARIRSTPLLEGNVVAGNATAGIARGDYAL